MTTSSSSVAPGSISPRSANSAARSRVLPNPLEPLPARSLVVTSNLPFSRWGDVLSDHVVASAMIDRIVHHAAVLTLKDNTYRLRNTEIDTLPSHRNDSAAD